VPLNAVEWPAHLSKTEPLLLGAAAMSTRAVARDKRRLKSSGVKDTSLPRSSACSPSILAAHAGASRSSSSGRASHHELLDEDYGGIYLELPSASCPGVFAQRPRSLASTR
jgi:hypothetical protein